MKLAGIEVARLAVLELADLLLHAGHNDTAALVLLADAAGDEHVDLTITDRETLLAVLTDPPEGLLELRAVLLAEHVGRKRDGLA